MTYSTTILCPLWKIDDGLEVGRKGVAHPTVADDPTGKEGAGHGHRVDVVVHMGRVVAPCWGVIGRHLGWNSVDILDGLYQHFNPHLN